MGNLFDKIIGKAVRGALPNHENRPAELPNAANPEDFVIRKIASLAFEPDIRITNEQTIATLKPKTLVGWASAKDFIITLRKIYPDCHFDDDANPTKVIFTHGSSVKFAQDFKQWQTDRHAGPRQA